MRRKKLQLHRETLRTLGQDHLGQAAGGTNTHEFNTGGACTVGCGTGNCGTVGGGGSGNTCTCINPLSYCVC